MDERLLFVDTPQGEHFAPEGFYMLVVVDDNDNTPSPGQWVRFESL